MATPRERPHLTLIEGRGHAPQTPAAPPLAAALELAALGAGFVLAMALLAAVPTWHRDIARVQGLAAAGFGFQALALLRRARWAALPHVGAVVFTVALAARAALVPVSPTLSGDIHRYVWEGRVVAAGGNPYRHPPADPALAPLRDAATHPRINHPGLASVYPPGALAGFALVARLSPTVWAMKLWVALHDLALVAVLIAWASAAGAGPAAAIAYAWSPLVLIEYAGSGHHDPTALVWLAVALWLARRRPVLSALALVVGVTVKLAPLVALPFLWRRWNGAARVLGVAGAVLGVASYLVLTRGPASGLDAYGRHWRNNELAFHYLDAALGDPVLARTVVAGAVLGILALAWARRWHEVAATRHTLRMALLLSPVVHPWYLGWVLALEPFAPSWPWLVLSLTALLNYGPLATPADLPSHHPTLAWRWVEYGVPAALALALGWARRDRRVGNPAGGDRHE